MVYTDGAAQSTSACSASGTRRRVRANRAPSTAPVTDTAQHEEHEPWTEITTHSWLVTIGDQTHKTVRH